MKTRNSIWSPNEIDLIKTILIHRLEQEMRCASDGGKGRKKPKSLYAEK